MMISDLKEADLHRRYAQDADRALTRALQEFWALKEREAALGSEDVADEDESGIEDESPPPESEPAPPPVADVGLGGAEEEVYGTPTEALRGSSRNEPEIPINVPLIPGTQNSYDTMSGVVSDITKPLCEGIGVRLSEMWLPSPPKPPPGR
jgi:hypothetical protein